MIWYYKDYNGDYYKAELYYPEYGYVTVINKLGQVFKIYCDNNGRAQNVHKGIRKMSKKETALYLLKK